MKLVNEFIKMKIVEIWRNFERLGNISPRSPQTMLFLLESTDLSTYTTLNWGSGDIRLTNRFHVAVHLFSNRSQMMSKCGKNKKVAHKATAECVTDVLTTF